MEIVGKITQTLPEKSGQSARGPWRKQEYILETKDQYPKQICFMVWGDKIDELGISEGQELKVSVDIESREFNGRWYTDVKAWRVEPLGQQSAGGGGQPPQGFPEEPPPHTEDDIPF